MADVSHNLPVLIAKPKRTRTRHMLRNLFLLGVGWKLLLVGALAAGLLTH